MRRRDLRRIIINGLYQNQLLDLDLDELFENNLNYDLITRFDLEEDNPMIHPDKNHCDYDFNDKEEISFVIEVITNAIDNKDNYIKVINNRLKDWSFERLGLIERSILLMALSELDLKTAEKAVIIDEAIELTKVYCDDDAYGLINGVLDYHE